MEDLNNIEICYIKDIRQLKIIHSKGDKIPINFVNKVASITLYRNSIFTNWEMSPCESKAIFCLNYNWPSVEVLHSNILFHFIQSKGLEIKIV